MNSVVTYPSMPLSTTLSPETVARHHQNGSSPYSAQWTKNASGILVRGRELVSVEAHEQVTERSPNDTSENDPNRITKVGAVLAKYLPRHVTWEGYENDIYVLLGLATKHLRHDVNGKLIVHGAWNIPGGAMEPGETKKEALLRELQEEVGGLHPSFDTSTFSAHPEQTLSLKASGVFHQGDQETPGVQKVVDMHLYTLRPEATTALPDSPQPKSEIHDQKYFPLRVLASDRSPIQPPDWQIYQHLYNPR